MRVGYEPVVGTLLPVVGDDERRCEAAKITLDRRDGIIELGPAWVLSTPTGLYFAPA